MAARSNDRGSELLRAVPFHPLLFAVFPAVSLFSANADEIRLLEAARATLACAVLGCAIYGVAFAVLRNSAHAAIQTTLFLVWFWLFNYVLRAVIAVTGPISPGWWLGVFLSWSLGFALIGRHLARRPRASSTATSALNVVGAALVVTALLPLAFVSRGDSWSHAEVELAASRSASSPSPFEAPDVFVIVLDAYGRRDLLEEHFGYRDALSEGLEARGFYVAERSTCNYNQTKYSLPSMLNYRYLDNLSPLEILPATCSSAARATLREHGYRFSACASGFRYSTCWDADRFIDGAEWSVVASLSNFEQLLVNATPLEYVLRRSKGGRSPYAVHRQRILGCLDALPAYGDNGTRDFVLAHLLSPHEPFIFGRNGEDVSPYDEPYRVNNIYEDPDLPTTPGRVGPEYARRYRAQAEYIGGRVLATIDEIRERAHVPPVIIVQGDHGPYGFTPDLRDARYPILNAYSLPGAEAMAKLYPEITPVNSLRIVLNSYFDGDHELLPDVRLKREAIGWTQVADGVE